MKRFYAKEGNAYVNYISLFNNPLRLKNTYESRYVSKRYTTKKQSPHIVYTEKEAKMLIRLNDNIKLLEVTI